MAKIYSHFVGFLFTQLIISFTVQKTFELMSSTCQLLALIIIEQMSPIQEIFSYTNITVGTGQVFF